MDSSSLLADEASSAIARVNAHYWPGFSEASRRTQRRLSAGEILLLARYRSELTGHVLELGSRADGLTACLAQHAASLTAVAVSGPTAGLGRDRFPRVAFIEQTMTATASFSDASFDAVVIGDCALDLLPDDNRRHMLSEAHRVLNDDGILIFSSNNLACESLVPPPLRHALTSPRRFVRLPRMLRNRAQLSRLQQRERGFAILNGPDAHYGLLRYFISRDGQDRQLSDHDFGLLDAVTVSGVGVRRGEDAYGHRVLLYAARPRVYD